MEVQGISPIQIITVAIFLSGLFALKIFVTKNKNRITGNWKTNSRIQVIEEKSLSTSEKIRIVAIDSNQFLIISNKGKKTSLIPLPQSPKVAVSLPNREDLNRGPQHINNPMKQNIQMPVSSPTPNTLIDNPKGHQLSKAIKMAREMNPAVSYKK